MTPEEFYEYFSTKFMEVNNKGMAIDFIAACLSVEQIDEAYDKVTEITRSERTVQGYYR